LAACDKFATPVPMKNKNGAPRMRVGRFAASGYATVRSFKP
jgi:uncharacterized protein YodC (DUF2158 family)